MTLLIPISACERLKESRYNHNYYKLPFTIDSKDTVLVVSDDENWHDYYLGNGIFSSAGEGVVAYGGEYDKDPRTICLTSDQQGKHYT